MQVILTDHRGAPVPHPRRATGTGIALANQSPVRVSTTPLARRENAQLTGTAWRNVVYQTSAWEVNVPYVDGAVGRASDYRGAVTPYPFTEDADWNKRATEKLRETGFYDSASFDASGKFTLDEFQAQMWRYHDLAGDCLVIPVKDPEQRDRPVWRMIPALGIDSPGYGNSGDWIDGVRVGLHHRALAYHVLAEESAVNWKVPISRAGYTVDAADAIHFANWRAVGRSRGTTVFLSSGTTVVDLAMLDSALHRLFNLATKLAITFETEAGSGASPGKLFEGVAKDDTVPHPDLVAAVDSEPIDVERFKEVFMGEGPVVANLDPGQKANMHGSERDLPDVSAVRASDLERIALAYRLPVQVLLCIYSGAFNLTGPGFRVALTSAMRWREKQLKKMEPFAVRAYTAHIAWLLTTGQLPYPRKSIRPFRCNTNHEKVVGIDEARDVKLDAARLQMGSTDEFEIAHENGRNLHDVIAKRSEFIRAVCAQFGWTPSPEMWGPGWSVSIPKNPTPNPTP